MKHFLKQITLICSLNLVSFLAVAQTSGGITAAVFKNGLAADAGNIKKNATVIPGPLKVPTKPLTAFSSATKATSWNTSQLNAFINGLGTLALAGDPDDGGEITNKAIIAKVKAAQQKVTTAISKGNYTEAAAGLKQFIKVLEEVAPSQFGNLENIRKKSGFQRL